MTRRPGGVRAWLREVRAEGIAVRLERAEDRTAELARVRTVIDDDVLESILIRSYAAGKRGDDAEKLAWADLAVEASLHGGTGRGRANALQWHAQMHVGHLPKTSTERMSSLQNADRSIRAAVEILEEIGPAEDLTMAIAVRARVHSALGRGKAAFDDFHTVLTTMIRNGDAVGDMARRLVSQYWRAGNDSTAAARDLIGLTDQLLQHLEGQDTAALWLALGDAQRQLDDEQAALAAWATARQWYADQDDRSGLFEVDGHLFEFAVERERYEEALCLGERCLAGAPADADAKRISEHQHLLAAVKHELGHPDAMAAYERAIELADALERWSIGPSYRIEAAVLYIGAAQLENALRHLRQAASTAQQSVVRWAADDILADLQLNRLHNPAAAVRSADAALNTIIHSVEVVNNDELDSATIRASSLYRCGAAAYAAGDLDAAHRRVTELWRLLDEDLPATILSVTATYDHPVTPPARSAVAWLSHLVCLGAGRHAEAATYLARHEELVGIESIAVPPVDDKDLPPGYAALRDGGSALLTGVTMARTSPGPAIGQLLAAIEMLAEAGAPDVMIALAEQQLGYCRRRTGDPTAAKACYERALALAESSGGYAEIEFSCRMGLAAIAEAAGDLTAAETNLRRCVEITETARASFTGVDERIRFLTERLPVYERLVALQIRSGRLEQAYATAQLIKSRTLGELLTEPEHRPIDYTAEDEVAAVRADWHDWIGRYLDPRHDTDASRELDLLLAEKDRRDRLASVAERRRAQGLFDGLSGNESSVTYETVRLLLTQ
jgi:tetratricopeptide (TPR) repeat protein